MLIVLNEADLALLSEAARAELAAHIASARTSRTTVYPAPLLSEAYDGIDMQDVEDVTAKHIRRLMTGLSAPVRTGLQIMTEQGPVIRAQLLIDAGISPRFFQSGTTRRIRALTGDKAFLLGWDAWADVEKGQGRFALSPITHQSLQRHFGFA